MHVFCTINVFPFDQDVEKFPDQQDEKVESSGDSTDSEVEPHPLLEKFSKRGAKKSVKRKGRKCKWKETFGEWFSWNNFRQWHLENKAVGEKREKCQKWNLLWSSS